MALFQPSLVVVVPRMTTLASATVNGARLTLTRAMLWDAPLLRMTRRRGIRKLESGKNDHAGLVANGDEDEMAPVAFAGRGDRPKKKKSKKTKRQAAKRARVDVPSADWTSIANHEDPDWMEYWKQCNDYLVHLYYSQQPQSKSNTEAKPVDFAARSERELQTNTAAAEEQEPAASDPTGGGAWKEYFEQQYTSTFETYWRGKYEEGTMAEPSVEQTTTLNPQPECPPPTTAGGTEIDMQSVYEKFGLNASSDKGFADGECRIVN